MNIFKKKRKVQEFWYIHYKDDVTFNERNDAAFKLLYRYRIIEPFGAKELYSDFKIHCGTHEEAMIPEANREVEAYLKIPFYY